MMVCQKNDQQLGLNKLFSTSGRKPFPSLTKEMLRKSLDVQGLSRSPLFKKHELLGITILVCATASDPGILVMTSM